jgi:ketosteroid isomerase-like protein
MPRLVPIYIGLLFLSFAPGFSPADEKAIRQVMDAQEKAWDRGDIPGFMEGYSDSVCFISKRGKTCGKAAVTANYVKSYPDKSAMGDLMFDQLEVLGAGADNAWCTGNWHLYREKDTIGGGFSLFWERTPKGWRILRDHTY